MIDLEYTLDFMMCSNLTKEENKTMRYWITAAVGLSFLLVFNVKAEEMKKAPIDTIFEQGNPNPYGKYFSGQTYLTMLSTKDDVWNSSIGNVTFEPDAKTNWHKHSGGQILLVLAGEGRYQERGKEIRILHPGDVVRIPIDVEHWHGAAKDSWCSHISIETNLPNHQTTWLEPVDLYNSTKLKIPSVVFREDF